MDKYLNNYYKNLLSHKEMRQAVEILCKLEKANNKAKERNKQLKNLDNKNLIQDNFFSDNKFQKVMDSLNPISAKIIKDDFLNKIKDKKTILPELSISSYYKYRNRAIEEFLYFYNI